MFMAATIYTLFVLFVVTICDSFTVSEAKPAAASIWNLATPNLYPLTYDNWTEVVSGGEWLLVFYVNDRCEACRYVTHHVEQFARAWGLEHDVKVALLDIKSYQIVEGRFLVIYAPTIFYIENGEVGEYPVHRKQRLPSLADLIEFVEESQVRGITDPRPAWLYPTRPYMWLVGASFVLYHMLHLEAYGDYLFSWARENNIDVWLVVKATGIIIVLVVALTLYLILRGVRRMWDRGGEKGDRKQRKVKRV